MIKTADWVIDLGPGGGVNGGEIVVEGTPERVAAEPKSFTGQYLKPLLARSTPTAPPEEPHSGISKDHPEPVEGSKPRRSSRAKSSGADAEQPDLIVAK